MLLARRRLLSLFICIIVDDANTDGEQEVILKDLDEYFVLPENDVYLRDETEDSHFSISEKDNPKFRDICLNLCILGKSATMAMVEGKDLLNNCQNC